MNMVTRCLLKMLFGFAFLNNIFPTLNSSSISFGSSIPYEDGGNIPVRVNVVRLQIEINISPLDMLPVKYFILALML